MKYLHIIAMIVVLFYGLKIEITLSPFTFQIHGWKEVIGFILIGIGIMMVVTVEHGKGYKKGAEMATEEIDKMLQVKIEQIKKQNGNNISN